jgi:hypothetical protein
MNIMFSERPYIHEERPSDEEERGAQELRDVLGHGHADQQVDSEYYTEQHEQVRRFQAGDYAD